MFGHNNDNQQQDNMHHIDPTTVTPTDGPVSSVPEPPVSDAPAENSTDSPHMELPSSIGMPATTDDSGAPAPATTAPVSSDGTAAVPSELLNLKQQALQNLSPLVDHLDQTPEERFRTTMMMIQATDDSSKIKDAYDAAQAITDEKARAQALLDVVNEINYFTQQGNHAGS